MRNQGLMGRGDIEAKNRAPAGLQTCRYLATWVERPWPDGRMIEIRGNPMPGGGFVATFYRCHRVFDAPPKSSRRSNETLEQRVVARTTELEQAKLHAERASEAKTRFLAAVSHDLVQPLNAAQLLTHSLSGRLDGKPESQPLKQISGALAATEKPA